jgi:outer membrane protein assembly factor BamB
MAVASAALALTSGCFGWQQSGYDAGHSSNNPHERALTAATVGGIAPVWSQAGPVLGLVSSGNRVHAVRYGDAGGVVSTYRSDNGTEVWTGRLERYVHSPYVAVLGDTVAVTTGAQQEAFGHNVPPPYLLSAAFDVVTGEDRTHPFGAYAYPTTGDPSGQAAYGNHVALVPLGGATTVMYDDARPDARLGGNTPLLDERAATAYVDGGPAIQAWDLTCSGPLCMPLWSHPGTTADAVLEASSGTLYVAGERLEALDATTGAVRWTAPVGSTMRPAVRDETVFVVDGGRLTAVPACGSASCTPAWSAALPAHVANGGDDIAIGGDVVYVATAGAEGGTAVAAYAADGCAAATCEPLTTVTAPGRAGDLLVANGRLVVGTDTGVYAFGLPA